MAHDHPSCTTVQRQCHHWCCPGNCIWRESNSGVTAAARDQCQVFLRRSSIYVSVGQINTVRIEDFWHVNKSSEFNDLNLFAFTGCALDADGSFSTSAGLKKDFFLEVGEVGGDEPLEKLEVEVAESLE